MPTSEVRRLFLSRVFGMGLADSTPLPLASSLSAVMVGVLVVLLLVYGAGIAIGRAGGSIIFVCGRR